MRASGSHIIQAYKTMKDAVLFAIHVSPTMLERPPKSENTKADRDSPTSAYHFES
jgi:ATP-dependent DNA helicase 2 subunit 1